MTNELLTRICLLFAGLFVVGGALCLPLYSWNLRAFVRSSLFTKLVWWIPIFAVFAALLYLGALAALIVSLLLLAQAGREITKNHAWRSTSTQGYALLFTIALLQLPLLFYELPARTAVYGLIGICFASALSDVCAFFGGKFFGRHHLPTALNAGKAWEGVAGQIVGAFAGLALVAALTPVVFSWQFALGIGAASAVGDLVNSFTKRRVGIKDWGATIPGHGGVLDRFSSLSLAIAVGFVILLV